MAKQFGDDWTFGGDWTENKLEILRKYLVPYATIMRKQNFRFAYIDAFAGTGYRHKKGTDTLFKGLFPELAEEESQDFLDGSARIALQIEPRFDKYIFIEQNQTRFSELVRLKKDFPDKAEDIELVNADANAWLIERCSLPLEKWHKHRAIVFLDPLGMQVAWKTIEAIASTKAIDLWILFPLGIAVNRLLVKGKEIPDSWHKRLDEIFGTSDWFDVFYQTYTNLFGKSETKKTANLEGIGRYYVERLGIFPYVAQNPRPLYNSKGNPLYLFCFASHNRTAVKIAQDILAK